MSPLAERASKVLQHEQRTNHADAAVKPGGLAVFFARWATEARAQGVPQADRLAAMFAEYATLDPMQRVARVRAALALLADAAPASISSKNAGKDGTRNNTEAPRKGTEYTETSRAIPHTSRVIPRSDLPVPSADEAPSRPAAKPASKPPAKAIPPVGEYLLDADVTVVPSVGPVMAEKLARLGIRTVRDLLYHLPREHVDFSTLLPIADLPFDEPVTTLGVIWEVENVRAGRVVRTVAKISDDSGSIRAVWFNQPYLQKQLPRGAQIVLTGVKQRFGNAISFTVKSHELPEQGDLINTGRLVPIYPLTEGLSAKALRRATKWVADRCASLVADYLPLAVRQSAQLLALPEALAEFHYPESGTALHRARTRLAFDELFLIQLGMLARRANWRVGPPAPEIAPERGWILTYDDTRQGQSPSLAAARRGFNPPARNGNPAGLGGDEPRAPITAGMGLWTEQIATAECFEASLPFALTNAQRRVIGEVLDDLARAQPMIRLIQGDVGSGKTVVAAAALLAAALCGFQGAIMAPTEILAEQHVRGLTRMLAPFGIQVAGLLGNQRAAARREALAQVASGQAQVVVGTHALIQEGVTFARLGVAVVDEQHRFGVEQRELLRRKGGDLTPHLLVMTATPIPRTLALSVYGDLDLSVIDQMPQGRLPIITRWRAGARRDEAYALVAQEIAQGRQAYIICPLIEESEALEAKAAVVEFERLQREVFPDLRLGLVHGGLKSAEKDATMRRFRDGEIDILVATAVVEVGVDVPNATVMLIEDADRFGLAQLHQFRGRVGRGAHQSYCYLLSEDASATARERLTAIESTTDGLRLAEEDLRLRGPGEFFGTRQSGLPELRVAELTDAELVALTRREADRLWQSDPFLQSTANRQLKERVAIFWQGFMGQ
jgi:ATP-dependent DNA helicase RecG